MSKVIKICQICNSEFEADTREVNRGNAKFCSLTCAGKNSHKNIKPIKHQCKHCGNNFYSKSLTVKYCSISCKQKNYRLKSSNNTVSMKTIYRKLKHLPCQICGWQEAARDVHHIKSVVKGGTNEISNLIVLCPNHHRMIHSKLISEIDLLRYVNQ